MLVTRKLRLWKPPSLPLPIDTGIIKLFFTCHYLFPSLIFSLVCPHLLRYVLKVLFQILNLVWVIFVHTKKPSHILVQVCISMMEVCVVLV